MALLDWYVDLIKSYSERLSELSWSTLELRRKYLCWVHLYKIIHGYSDVDTTYVDLTGPTRTRSKHDQAAKKIIFTACHLGQLRKLVFTSPDVISTSTKNFLTSRIDFTVLLLFEFLKKLHLPIKQVNNRTHWPDSKIH